MKNKPAISPWFWGWTLLWSTLYLGSCDDDIQCQKAEIEIRYVGYTLTELDTIIIRRYVKPHVVGNVAKDSAVWIQPNYVEYGFRGDTARQQWYNFPQSGQPFSMFMESAWDYEVCIPATGRTYLVTNIIEKQTREKSKRVSASCTGPRQFCVNPVQQLSINGNPVKPDQLFYATIYLNK